MRMKILRDSIEEIKIQLYEIMEKEAIWCEGKVLSLSQELDKLLVDLYINDTLK